MRYRRCVRSCVLSHPYDTLDEQACLAVNDVLSSATYKVSIPPVKLALGRRCVFGYPRRWILLASYVFNPGRSRKTKPLTFAPVFLILCVSVQATPAADRTLRQYIAVPSSVVGDEGGQQMFRCAGPCYAFEWTVQRTVLVVYGSTLSGVETDVVATLVAGWRVWTTSPGIF